MSAVSGNAHFDVSASGTLVYLPRRAAGTRNRSVVWIDATGREQALPIEPKPYTRAAVSPDGARIALATAGPDTRDLWQYTIGRGTLTRLTFDDPVDTAPVWTPDGRRVLYRSDRDGGIYVVGADGAASALRVTEAPAGTTHTPDDVTPDGRRCCSPRSARIAIRVPAWRRSTATVRSRGSWTTGSPSSRPRLSRDGRWMAYQSDETGRFEIYVRPFPRIMSARWQVSTAGGVSPSGAATDASSCTTTTGRSCACRSAAAPTSARERPCGCSALNLPGDPLGPSFDISPDGRRFLIVKAEDGGDGATAGPLLLVDHWGGELNARFPPP